ncbi:hypothetical protein V5O48_006374 [Marasmius crinis-equi]|uniref:BZIP domain-containing protein n=1 Tax=Marasmius crinis-equi TaxID=585013 RepID=A0ABR3FJM7_9AGAR
MLSFDQQPAQQPNQQNATAQPQLLQQQNQTMRLREEPPPINQPAQPATASRSRKRKSPPDQSISQDAPATAQPPPPGPQQIAPQHVMPAHAHPQMLQHYPFPAPPPEFNPNHSPGMPPPGPPPGAPGTEQQPHEQQDQTGAQGAAGGNRALSNSKRAEQNRKAQRAFRERRDQHVKALESRSQLLDAALASADEANRRWEECRALVDQLRVENATLRAALSQHVQVMPPLPSTVQPQQLAEQPKDGERKEEKKT